MRYIADSNGYLLEVSFGAVIQCNGASCKEYTGGVPSGYSSLAVWFAKEGDKLYRWKIAAGQLTLDSSVAVKPDPGPMFAPGDWGYGGAMDYIVDESGTFETKLEEILATMVNHSVKQFSLYDTKGLTSKKFFGTLWKYTANYATLEAINYDGNKAIKCKYNGTWGPWEWVNPPMAPGVEYRTTERHNGKPVYAYYVNIGSLPASGSVSFKFGIESTVVDNLVSMEVFAHGSSDRRYKFPFINTNAVTVAIARTTGDRTVYIHVWDDISGYTGHAFFKYTKV